jgi:hypothetical protein
VRHDRGAAYRGGLRAAGTWRWRLPGRRARTISASGVSAAPLLLRALTRLPVRATPAVYYYGRRSDRNVVRDNAQNRRVVADATAAAINAMKAPDKMQVGPAWFIVEHATETSVGPLKSAIRRRDNFTISLASVPNIA